jgi:hypothetical protein
MSPTVTDALCRISSGIGIETADSVQLEIARPIIITTPRNGIGDWIPRPDLAARCITVQLPTKITLPTPAALYTALSSTLAIGNPSWNRPPGLSLGALTESAAHADPLFSAITSLVQTKIEWTGTATDLLNEICVTAPVTCTTARALSQRLNLLTPALLSSGIEVVHHHKHRGTRLITLRKLSHDPSHQPDPPPDSTGSAAPPDSPLPPPATPPPPHTSEEARAVGAPFGILEFSNSRILEFRPRHASK